MTGPKPFREAKEARSDRYLPVDWMNVNTLVTTGGSRSLLERVRTLECHSDTVARRPGPFGGQSTEHK